MISRVINYPKKKSFFLLGPRGTGKTYWLKREFPGALWFDLLASDHYLDFLQSPQNLSRRIPSDFKGTIIIDEIQKVPALLDEVHRLIEHQGHRFVLTGSSARKLKRDGANLLAGRAIQVEMHPFSSLELGKSFELGKALRLGLLPLAYLEDEAEAYLKTYVETYLREEVLQESLVRDIAGFSRFLSVAAFSQGSLLNMSNVAHESAIGRKAAEGHFQILEDLLLGRKVYPFTRRAKRKTVSHPKFYYFDAGVFRALRRRGPLDLDSEVDGIALETLVYQNLMAVRANLGVDCEVFFWRTADDHTEVDFVVYGSNVFFAIEVKKSAHVGRDDLKGLEAFQRAYPQARAILLYNGERKYRDSGIEIWPIQNFFSDLGSLMGGSA